MATGMKKEFKVLKCKDYFMCAATEPYVAITHTKHIPEIFRTLCQGPWRIADPEKHAGDDRGQM